MWRCATAVAVPCTTDFKISLLFMHTCSMNFSRKLLFFSSFLSHATIEVPSFYKTFSFSAIFDHFCNFFSLFFFASFAFFAFPLGKKNPKKGPFLDCGIGRVGGATKLHSRIERKDIYAKAEKTIWKTVLTTSQDISSCLRPRY